MNIHSREALLGITAVVGSVLWFITTRKANAAVKQQALLSAPLVIDPSVYTRVPVVAPKPQELPAIFRLDPTATPPTTPESEELAPYEEAAFGLDGARNDVEPELDEYNALPLERSGLTYETRVRFEDLEQPTTTVKPTLKRFSWFRLTVLETWNKSGPAAIGGLQFLQGLQPISHPNAKTWNPHTGESAPFDGYLAWVSGESRELRVRFPSPIAVDHYRLRTSFYDRDLDPVSWRLEGSQNGVFWVGLDERKRAELPFERNAWAHYKMRAV